MAYQDWLVERINRFKAFFSDDSPGQILVLLALWDMGINYADYGVPGRPLDAWDFETELEAWAELSIRQLRVANEIHKRVNDDIVPSISPGIGIALNSVYFSGAEMIMGEDTTWVHPVIHAWDDLEQLRLDENNVWLQRIERISRKWADMNDGDYTQFPFAHFAPMDMANALRGNALFTDFYDAPEMVHKLMGVSVSGITGLEHRLRTIIPDVCGGTAIWGTWMPGKMAFMSEDATDLVSPRTYETFGRPYTNQVARACGGAWIHHHARGYPVHPSIAQVEDLRVLQISRDPNCQHPVQHLPALFEQTGNIPLMTHCSTRDVYEYIDDMLQGRLILQLTAEDLDDAKQTIAFIHSRTQAG